MHSLFSIVGTPSPTLYATMNILRTLVQVGVGDHATVIANDVSTARQGFLAGGANADQPTILFSDYPNSEMVSTYYRGEGPLTICLDDFTTVAHYSAVARDLVGVVAARFAMMGIVNLKSVVISPPPQSLIVRGLDVSVEMLIRGLISVYNFSNNEQLLERSLAYLNLTDHPEITLRNYARNALTDFHNAREILERRSALDSELIDFLAPYYDEIFRCHPLQELEWPTYALLRPEFPDRLTVGPIELTGPARTFYFGPYFALPAGLWRAEIAFEVQDCFSDNEIAIDAFAETILVIAKVKLPTRGVYSCEIRFAIRDPSKPVEIRLQLLTGAIEGVLLLRSINLRRVASSADGGEGSRAA